MPRKATTTSSSKPAAKAPEKAPAKATPAADGRAKAAATKGSAPATSAAKKAPAKKAVAPAKTAASAKSSGPTKETAPAKAAATGAVKAKARPERTEFLAQQRQLLLDERSSYVESAAALKAQADSLALEHEPGDVQFDEEGGEGGTANVDREMDLHLSAQARATVLEIDRALAKIEEGTYGQCEQCGDPIPEPRLQALPHAALCVACKSGGLSSRR
ncbi:MAG TPA: TraR/DksA C4-type zinc finger protein [Acidimicrobiales bacterium]|nr:TraR/DksA C4-type zinc finger protein [Acidimicrobiales bacterium]